MCPICGQPRIVPMPDELKGVVVGEMHDPGGVALRLNDGRTMRIAGECDSCDFKKITDFIGAGQ